MATVRDDPMEHPDLTAVARRADVITEDSEWHEPALRRAVQSDVFALIRAVEQLRAPRQVEAMPVPQAALNHVRAVISHMGQAAALAKECGQAAVDLDPNRFQALRRELLTAQQHLDTLVVVASVAWEEAL